MTKYLIAFSAALALALALERDRHADTAQQLADMKAAGLAQAEVTRLREMAAAEALTKIQQEHTNETNDLRRRAADLALSLRDRPSASSGPLPEGATAGPETHGWCAGDRLYREHAEAFAGQASLAAELQVALRTCMAAHEAAVEMTK